MLPRTRYFPADAEVGRWLRSSSLDLTASGAVSSPPPTTTTAARRGFHIADSYWSDDRTEYFVVIAGLSSRHNYCEAHLTRNGRRIGEWSNELWSGARSQVIISIYLGLNYSGSFDAVEVECS